jgi:hypothetical protein
VLVDGSGLSGPSGLSGEKADRYLRKSVSICGLSRRRLGEGGFVCSSRPFAVLFCALCALLRLSRLCYRLFAERVSFELVNSFFDAAGARFWGLGTFDRYGDRLFFAVG